MSINLKQNDDGSQSEVDNVSGAVMSRIGGNGTLQYRQARAVRIPLAAVDTAGGLFAWQNTTGAAIFITRTLIYTSTKSTAACTADIGVAANGTTSNDTLIDGLDVGTAAGTFDNITDKGTNGKSRQRLASGSYVTGSVATGASAGIVGYAIVEFIPQ